MTTFDLVRIQDFVASLDARMGPGLNGARDDHAALAIALREHGELCREFTEKVREWGRSVFSARVEFDPKVESVFLAEGSRLSARAKDLRGLAASVETVGASPDGATGFETEVGRLDHLLKHWIRPQRSVGPGPRSWQHLTPEMVEERRRRIADLPPLPADWVPADPEQRARYLKLRHP